MVSFDVTRKEMALIRKIVDRAMIIVRKLKGKYKRLDCEMDLTATHANGCPLDLEKLLAADDFNFSHDVFGIRQHINRETGKLERCFLPRCAKPKEAK